MFCLQLSTFRKGSKSHLWTISSMLLSCLTLETQRKLLLASINYIHLTNLLKKFLFCLLLSVWSFSIWKKYQKGQKIFSNGYYVSTQREGIIWKTRKGFGGVTQGLAGFDLQSKARGGWSWGLKGKRNTRSKYFWNCSLVWTDTQTRKWRVCSWLRPRKALLQNSLKHHGSCLLVFVFMEKNHYSMSLWWCLTLTDLKKRD